VPDVEIVEDFTVPSLEKAFSDRVCAFVLEPVQGEGASFPFRSIHARRRELCDKYNALLVVDEIQCGLGRTGKYLPSSTSDLTRRPDSRQVPRGRIPLGAMIGSDRVAGCLKPGDHGTTFGGGPLACRLALEVLDIIEQEGMIARVTEMGNYLIQELKIWRPGTR